MPSACNKYFRCFMIFKSSALALLLLKPYFQDHVVNIYSQDYSIMIEKEAIFQPRLFKPWLLLLIWAWKCFFLTDHDYSAFQSLQFIRGLQGFTDTTPPTVFVRGNRYPNYQEVVTRYPLCGSSELLYLVACLEGRSSLSFGLIVPDNRYFMHHLIHSLSQLDSGV